MTGDESDVLADPFAELADGDAHLLQQRAERGSRLNQPEEAMGGTSADVLRRNIERDFEVLQGLVHGPFDFLRHLDRSVGLRFSSNVFAHGSFSIRYEVMRGGSIAAARA